MSRNCQLKLNSWQDVRLLVEALKDAQEKENKSTWTVKAWELEKILISILVSMRFLDVKDDQNFQRTFKDICSGTYVERKIFQISLWKREFTSPTLNFSVTPTPTHISISHLHTHLKPLALPINEI